MNERIWGVPNFFSSIYKYYTRDHDMTLLSYRLLWTRILLLLVYKIYQDGLFWELDQDIIDHVSN